jgi:putative transposase
VFSDHPTTQLFIDELLALRDELGFLLISYVVMPDHVHLILVPGPGAGLARIMQHVKGRFARRLHERNGDQGSLWQPRYYETVIRDEASLLRRVDYVEQNPVAAGLASEAPAYPYSSAANPTGDLEGYLSGAAMANWPG